jgi:uncharacterized protein
VLPDPPVRALNALLDEKLADSLGAPVPEAPPRRVPGPVHFPGKATAVVGMRRAGKTTFLHRIRSERLEAGGERQALPYVSRPPRTRGPRR